MRAAVLPETWEFKSGHLHTLTGQGVSSSHHKKCTKSCQASSPFTSCSHSAPHPCSCLPLTLMWPCPLVCQTTPSTSKEPASHFPWVSLGIHFPLCGMSLSHIRVISLQFSSWRMYDSISLQQFRRLRWLLSTGWPLCKHACFICCSLTLSSHDPQLSL